jgi:hypothetical protein
MVQQLSGSIAPSFPLSVETLEGIIGVYPQNIAKLSDKFLWTLDKILI